MPTRLSEPLVRDALTRLTGWSGDDQTIHRDFVADAVARKRLCTDLDALAELVHHSILVADRSGGLGVTLSTADVDGVSEVDIAVASRINDLFNGSAAGQVPRQRQPASLNTGPVSADGVDERAWWSDSDDAEPLMGVPAASSGVMPAPLPDTAPHEPEPGIEPQQEPQAEVPHVLG